jgi:hypothetical protein
MVETAEREPPHPHSPLCSQRAGPELDLTAPSVALRASQMKRTKRHCDATMNTSTPIQTLRTRLVKLPSHLPEPMRPQYDVHE